MLRVTIDLVPFGQEDKAKKIGELVIANDLSGGYEAWTAPDLWSNDPAMFGRLNEYDRTQSPWELVRLILETIRLEKHVPDLDDDSLSQRLKKRLKLNA